jgi:CheY-like chemotaxis protein
VSDAPKVLLAEDLPDHLYITRGLLEECGCAVVTAPDGAEAVKAAERERPDMILLDLRMPVLDGFEAARRIRRVLPRVPMVAYTAAYSYSMTGEALDAGFDEYLIKPVTLGDMRKLLERYLPGKIKKGDAEKGGER